MKGFPGLFDNTFKMDVLTNYRAAARAIFTVGKIDVAGWRKHYVQL